MYVGNLLSKTITSCFTLLLCLSYVELSAAASQVEGNTAIQKQSLTVYVDDFPPYINSANKPLGSAARTLKVLGKYADVNIDFEYLPYSDAMALMRLQRDLVSFPYFYTEQRAEEFYFSEPISTVSIQVFYSRQFNNIGDRKNLEALKVGKVDGNSYGQEIDNMLVNAEIFDNEINAVAALMNNTIDVLPMAKGVMDAIIQSHYSAQKELIRPILAIQGTEKFHLMAPKSDYGKQVIDTLNAAIKLKFGNETPLENKIESAPKVDLAELIPAEGFPAIIGKGVNDDESYTLPIGTKAIVLDWSEGIRRPNSATNINRNMLLTSKVVILNGPHVGKEMMVRNMHIQLQ
ncbi:substrate-binding periplasmic protein [Glaciecola petra]|uniref:Transporter substrate-binding domain-containing protein n=1 Tax=Glaciecola petra TaxID=3075602 RepID=A0ABU2ZP21_9ALTE|nr:transporter substrate-binding domain-containing protein [Aestuariibacter sp. P117]MDT0594373.1 transporter substrate-binding domain-containing protein [Aestuariibacter sp. P117]